MKKIAKAMITIAAIATVIMLSGLGNDSGKNLELENLPACKNVHTVNCVDY